MLLENAKTEEVTVVDTPATEEVTVVDTPATDTPATDTPVTVTVVDTPATEEVTVVDTPATDTPKPKAKRKTAKRKTAKQTAKKQDAALVNGEVSPFLPLISKQDAARQTQTQTERLQAIDVEIDVSEKQLAKHLRAKQRTDMLACADDIEKLEAEKAAINLKLDAAATAKLPSARVASVKYVPTIFGIIASITELQALLTEQREIRSAFIAENAESKNEEVTALVATYTADLQKFGKFGDKTATKRTSRRINDDGSATWRANKTVKTATAEQVERLREVYAEAVSRKERLPMSFVTEEAITMGIFEDDTDGKERNDNWTALSNIVKHVPENTIAKLDDK